MDHSDGKKELNESKSMRSKRLSQGLASSHNFGSNRTEHGAQDNALSCARSLNSDDTIRKGAGSFRSLHYATLDYLRTFFASYEPRDTLDDDPEMTSIMTKKVVPRSPTFPVNYGKKKQFKNMPSSRMGSLTEDPLYDGFYQGSTGLVYGEDILKEALSLSVKHDHDDSNINSSGKNELNVVENPASKLDLDARTVVIIQRVLGIKMSKADQSFFISDDDNKGDDPYFMLPSKRRRKESAKVAESRGFEQWNRTTRGMAWLQQEAAIKRDQMGINALISAIDELDRVKAGEETNEALEDRENIEKQIFDKKHTTSLSKKCSLSETDFGKRVVGVPDIEASVRKQKRKNSDIQENNVELKAIKTFGSYDLYNSKLIASVPLRRTRRITKSKLFHDEFAVGDIRTLNEPDNSVDVPMKQLSIVAINVDGKKVCPVQLVIDGKPTGPLLLDDDEKVLKHRKKVEKAKHLLEKKKQNEQEQKIEPAATTGNTPTLPRISSSVDPPGVEEQQVVSLQRPKEIPPLLFDPISDPSNNELGLRQRSDMSLALLDWRRRQQTTHGIDNKDFSDFFPSSNEDVTSLLPNSTSVEDIELIEPLDVLRKKASSSKVQTRRHADETYASWCSKISNFLNGSGRRMLYCEFFYSDIDRAWFNTNSLRQELAKYGIPSDVKLSRSEWSYIRRRIRRRPRRFSKRFIQQQTDQLLQYREHVRAIQNNPNHPMVPFFGYEVPAPIKVGATVTALNKQARILHRGVVLYRDAGSKGYLVQFQRRELGFEFVPDTEIASHGIPELIVSPASPGQLSGEPGCLPYGTTLEYSESRATTNNIAKGPHSIVSVTNGPDRSYVDSQVESRKAKVGQNITVNDNIDDAIERETLIQLMSALNKFISRKRMILKCLAEFHDAIRSNQQAKKHGAAPDLDRRFKGYYAWLHSNLALNNSKLESALSFMRIMYGKAYTGRQISSERNLESSRIARMENRIAAISTKPQLPHSRWENIWASSVSSCIKEVGEALSASGILSLPDEIDTSRNGTDNCSNKRDDMTCVKFMEKRLVDTVNFLLTSCVCDEANNTCVTNDGRVRFDPETHRSNFVGTGTFNSLISEALEKLKPKAVKSRPSQEGNADDVRISAFRELELSVKMLQSEMAASKATR